MASKKDTVENRMEELASLREKIATAKATRADNDAAATEAITLAQMDAEKARLEAQLAYEEGLAKSSGVEGASTLLASLESQATAMTAPAEVSVPDTEPTAEG